MGWSDRRGARSATLALVATLVIGLGSTAHAAVAPGPDAADKALDQAIQKFVTTPGASPGVVSVVQRGNEIKLHAAGAAEIGAGAPTLDDHMRIASVSKAFSGAAALALVADGGLSLDDTIGKRLPNLPGAWKDVTLAQALQHRSGLPDYTQSKSFEQAFATSASVAPTPIGLLSFVEREPLEFKPGSKYRYSNSDNIVVGLMIEAVTGRPYEANLQERVFGPLGLPGTSLPRDTLIPSPFMHGYAVAPPNPPQDESQALAAGWAWASGGIISTPADVNRFVRAYATGATTDKATVAKQFKFVKGESDPPGPGTNEAGLAIFRYKTRCGTVYGHTGAAPGFTQLITATRDGSRSATVSVNAQIAPATDPKTFSKLRHIYELAVCAALAGTK